MANNVFSVALPAPETREKPYRVVWENDIHATCPQDAAEQALEMHRDPESIATSFTVIVHKEDDAVLRCLCCDSPIELDRLGVVIDLLDEEGEYIRENK